MSLIPEAFLTVASATAEIGAREAKTSLRPWILPLKPAVLLCKADFSSFPTKEAKGRGEGIEEGLEGGGEEKEGYRTYLD